MEEEKEWGERRRGVEKFRVGEREEGEGEDEKEWGRGGGGGGGEIVGGGRGG